jgi:hypothetical protein
MVASFRSLEDSLPLGSPDIRTLTAQEPLIPEHCISYRALPAKRLAEKPLSFALNPVRLAGGLELVLGRRNTVSACQAENRILDSRMFQRGEIFEQRKNEKRRDQDNECNAYYPHHCSPHSLRFPQSS